MKRKRLLTGAALCVAGLALVSFIPMLKPAEVISSIDFGSAKDGANWVVMNDGVMGGLSTGASNLTENSLILKGEISLANNGGFSSVRAPWGKTDLSGFEKVNIRYRSTGQTVALCLETNRRWWLPYFMLDLESTGGAWKTASLELQDAQEISVVTPTGDRLSKKQLQSILRIGFMTHEKKASTFEFEVDSVVFE